MDDKRVFGYCECCTDEITDTSTEYFVDSEGRVYCSIECVFDKLGIVKIEV